jgi:hypothetical protein
MELNRITGPELEVNDKEKQLINKGFPQRRQGRAVPSQINTLPHQLLRLDEAVERRWTDGRRG